MPEARRRPRPRGGGVAGIWSRLDTEQRVAGIGALLLVVSTFGPFSFVEAAIALTGLGVLALLRQRADGKEFHLPGGDGTVILLAGAWSALLIVIRILDRPLGQSVLALACAAIVAAAGLRRRMEGSAVVRAPSDEDTTADETSDEDLTSNEDVTAPLDPHDARTVPLRPPADT